MRTFSWLVDLAKWMRGLVDSSQRDRRRALKRLRKFRGSLPADFKFDREEANSR